jgi:hypothetical protein
MVAQGTIDLIITLTFGVTSKVGHLDQFYVILLFTYSSYKILYLTLILVYLLVI